MATKTDPLDIAKWGILLAGGYLVFTFFKRTGLIPSATDQQASNLDIKIDSKDWTKPDFYKKPAPTGYEAILYTVSATQNMINDIYDSRGFFNDCESCIVGTLRKIQYKTQYSWLANAFYNKYKKDMTAYIREGFNETELYPAWLHLESLPVYRKK